MRDVFSAPAMLLIGNDPTDQHPLLAYQIRNNVRLHGARLYVVNSNPIKLRRQATVFQQVPAAGGESMFVRFLAGDNASAELTRRWMRDALALAARQVWPRKNNWS